MKETGILFTPENVQKVIDNLKPMTRRLTGLEYVNQAPDEFELVAQHDGLYHFTRKGTGVGGAVKCPYGGVGDLLWVKEGLEAFEVYKVQYRNGKHHVFNGRRWVWKRDYLSPLHMPKWAARTWLELTAVRVERLQNISELDCEADIGAKPYSTGNLAYSLFRELWISINGQTSYDLNLWVWVLEYKQVSR